MDSVQIENMKPLIKKIIEISQVETADCEFKQECGGLCDFPDRLELVLESSVGVAFVLPQT